MWFECFPLRRVAYTVTGAKTVSTVLIGLVATSPTDAEMYESAWWDTGEGGARRGDIEIQARYQTRAEAIAGHARLVKQARKEVQ